MEEKERKKFCNSLRKLSIRAGKIARGFFLMQKLGRAADGFRKQLNSVVTSCVRVLASATAGGAAQGVSRAG